MKQQEWRWAEVDPWGHAVYCSDDTWQRKPYHENRPELYTHEDVIRETIRDPHQLWDDLMETARVQQRNPDAQVVGYVGSGRGRGRYTDHLIVVMVKWLPEPPTHTVVGYVGTMFLPRRLQSHLALRWKVDL